MKGRPKKHNKDVNRGNEEGNGVKGVGRKHDEKRGKKNDAGEEEE